MKQEKAQFQKLLNHLTGWLPQVRRYSIAGFIVFIVLIYGFIVFRVHTLITAEPAPDQVSSQVKAIGSPHIDQAIVQQLQSLQDNSVSVQALFDQARNNPFQQ